MTDAQAWRRCNTCKGPIAFESTFYRCSVSTCTRRGTDYAFCSVPCWEAHVPMMRHRDAWAVEEKSPSRAAWEQEVAQAARAEQQQSAEEAPARRVVGSELNDAELPRDVLIVVSKLKKYIKARSGMNTSDNTVSVLSDHVRQIATQAIRVAAADGRKTVLDRDFVQVLKNR